MKAAEFKRALHSHRILVGFQQFLPYPALTEMAGFAGFDWVWLCAEHGSLTIGTELENLTRTANAMGLTSIVRITQNDYSLILRSLEMGANGILVPRVRTRTDSEHAVEWVKYPPMGTRGICSLTHLYGYGTLARSPEDMNDETIVMVLIEQVDAFDRLDDILSVPGVDCAMFGGGDLSMELGLKMRMDEGDEEALEILEGYRRPFIEACRRNGVAMAEIIRDVSKVPPMIEEGVTVFASLPDTAVIQRTLTGLVQGVSASVPEATRSRA